MTCEQCKFWDNGTKAADDDQDVTGLCRASAPKINKITGRAVWPFTEDTDWCEMFIESEKVAAERAF